MSTQAATKTIANVIAGEERAAVSGETIEKYAPATGELLSRVARSRAEDVDAAIRAAQEAQPGWARTPAVERGRILREIGRVSRRYVIVNMSFSSPIYRLRRRLKHKLGLPNSATSSTREEITREVAEAGLRIEAERFVLPLVSEDLLLLLSKK